MNRSSLARRRFRVVARPKERARRARFLGAACAVFLLGAIAVAAARHAAFSLANLASPRFPLPRASGRAVALAAVVGGIAEPMRSLAQAAADAIDGSAGEKAAAIRRKFSCVADVIVRRPWGEKSSTLTLVMRRALAPALCGGRMVGFLSEDGVVFDAPQGVYSFTGPSVDVGNAPAAELKTLAREWPLLSAAGAFPAPLSEFTYVSKTEEDPYWEARLTDGMTIAWGHLEWTKQKFVRLKEALADARNKRPGVFAADLRWFEDGKVLLKPVAPALTAGAHKGGVK